MREDLKKKLESYQKDAENFSALSTEEIIKRIEDISMTKDIIKDSIDSDLEEMFNEMLNDVPHYSRFAVETDMSECTIKFILEEIHELFIYVDENEGLCTEINIESDATSAEKFILIVNKMFNSDSELRHKTIEVINGMFDDDHVIAVLINKYREERYHRGMIDAANTRFNLLDIKQDDYIRKAMRQKAEYIRICEFHTDIKCDDNAHDMSYLGNRCLIEPDADGNFISTNHKREKYSNRYTTVRWVNAKWLYLNDRLPFYDNDKK